MVPRPQNREHPTVATITTEEKMPRRKRAQEVTPNPAEEIVISAAGDDSIQSHGARAPPLVTPSTVAAASRSSIDADENVAKATNARRTLFPSRAARGSSLVTPQSEKSKAEDEGAVISVEPQAKRRLIFGKYVDLIVCQPNVEHAYKIIRRLTGSIGGNAYVGPIYGELTMGSMQKMVNLMMEHTGFGKDSRFIDVGSGIGKPNIHVAQYPGVAFSCGVEVEFPRWTLGMTNLKAVLQEAVAQHHANDQGEEDVDEACCLRGNTVFLHKDITEAKTFDPFSHVYMFSIGFPPPLWLELSKMWNRSQSPYLICYHSPKDIIHSYEFDVELVAQEMTSMHGSKEQHMGYIYRRRKSGLKEASTGACDALFAPSWDLVKKGLLSLHEDVAKQVDMTMGRGRMTRSRK